VIRFNASIFVLRITKYLGLPVLLENGVYDENTKYLIFEDIGVPLVEHLLKKDNLSIELFMMIVERTVFFLSLS
jgi:hypothetical protein